MTNNKIILVDDDANLLAAYARQLKNKFQLATAGSGQEALDRIAQDGPFAVIVSDLRMPGMDGIGLLSRLKTIAPDTARILLTGFADLQAAQEAVNQGHVFRLLTKPCPLEIMVKALADGLAQHEMIVAQREIHILRRLKMAMLGVVQGFATAVEARDRYTAGHQRRVTDLALTMAAIMGLDEEKTETIRLAGLVHDLGKIYVPAEFLTKPGPLSHPEMEIIRSHPQVGHDILKPVDFHWPISQVVLQHHERLDGSGYPQGLKGEEILREARIIGVADVFDAMVSDRPYRRGLGWEDALRELKVNSGRAYDPEVVAACLAALDGRDPQNRLLPGHDLPGEGAWTTTA